MKKNRFELFADNDEEEVPKETQKKEIVKKAKKGITVIDCETNSELTITPEDTEWKFVQGNKPKTHQDTFSKNN